MRLIDADKLTKDLIENKSFYPAIVKRAIEEAPTEDVVPRAEVNVLCAKIMHLEEDYADMVTRYIFAKQEVASTIIEHFISKKESPCQAKCSQDDIDNFFLRLLEFWDYIDNFVGLTGEEILAELKKKYIGE